MLVARALRAVRQIVGARRPRRDGRRRGLAAVRPCRDHGDPRAPGRDGGDQRARQETRRLIAMSGDHRQELADNRKLWDAWTRDPHRGRLLRRAAIPRRPRRRADRARGSATRWATSPGSRCCTCSATSGSTRCRGRASARARVTGVDFSEPAIAFARELAAEVGLADRSPVPRLRRVRPPGPARGRDVRCRVHGPRGPRVAARPRAVGRGRRGLREAGRDLLHPRGTPGAVGDRRRADDSCPTRCALAYDYWGGETLTFPVEGSYADPDADVDADVEHGWNHSLGEIVTVLARSGLRIELLDEKRQLGWPAPFLVPDGEGHHVWPPGMDGALPADVSPCARARTAKPPCPQGSEVRRRSSVR